MVSESSAWDRPLAGTLHVNVAFDWGEEIDLEQAQSLAPATYHVLPRRSRTPPSIAYRPRPLRFRLTPVTLDLPGAGPLPAEVEATVFDFGGVTLRLQIPFSLPAETLSHLAGGLADAEPLVAVARAAAGPLFDKLLPAIDRPRWSELTEEYLVFQWPPGTMPFSVEDLLERKSAWLAGLLKLEDEPLGKEEIEQSLRLRLRYGPNDLFLPEWSAAVLVDDDCGETLETIAFANLQLLEFRLIDNRLDDELAAAYRLIHPLVRSWLPIWRSQARSLRKVGDMKIEAHAVFERTNNVLKLIGDQYLSRLYRLLGARFHLDDWSASIERSLSVAEGVYQVVSQQAAGHRTEFLELVVIALIASEIVLALFRH
ncbi:MAG: hypothetical protein U0836_19710 [Pirellulales bacterium]